VVQWWRQQQQGGAVAAVITGCCSDGDKSTWVRSCVCVGESEMWECRAGESACEGVSPLTSISSTPADGSYVNFHWWALVDESYVIFVSFSIGRQK
jgi:hypothetical protein